MDNIRFIMISIITLGVLGLVGYWAFGTLQSGSEHEKNQEISKLEEENENLQQQIESLEEELAVFQAKYPEPTPTTAVSAPIEEPKTTPAVSTKYKHQSLISELQELVDDSVYMKLKSKGSRVGSVQEFLNLYNKTSTKVDNDFGASTKTALTAFQKKEGLTADGEAGPSTYKRMIEWLKKQG